MDIWQEFLFDTMINGHFVQYPFKSYFVQWLVYFHSAFTVRNERVSLEKRNEKTKERTRDHLVSFLLKLKNELTIPTHLSTIYLSINSPVRKSKMAYSKRAELANVTKENHWGWRATKRNYEAAAFILFNPRTFSLFFYFFSLFLPLSSVTLRLIYLVHDYRSGI